MKFGHQMRFEPEPIQLAPLIDVVFLILIFFLVTSVFGANESAMDITLPTASNAAQLERTQGEIIINLRADGGIVVNDRTIGADELDEVLKRVAEYFPGGAVIVRGDTGASLGSAVRVLDACRKADIQNVSFAAVPPAGRPAPAPAS